MNFQSRRSFDHLSLSSCHSVNIYSLKQIRDYLARNAGKMKGFAICTQAVAHTHNEDYCNEPHGACPCRHSYNNLGLDGFDIFIGSSGIGDGFIDNAHFLVDRIQSSLHILISRKMSRIPFGQLL